MYAGILASQASNATISTITINDSTVTANRNAGLAIGLLQDSVLSNINLTGTSRSTGYNSL